MWKSCQFHSAKKYLDALRSKQELLHLTESALGVADGTDVDTTWLDGWDQLLVDMRDPAILRTRQENPRAPLSLEIHVPLFKTP